MIARGSLTASERHAYSTVRRILSRPGLIRGSLVMMGRTCGKASCRCARSAKHRHRALYVAVNDGGRRRMIYVPAAWETRVREWVGRYGEIREILDTLSAACVERLRNRKE